MKYHYKYKLFSVVVGILFGLNMNAQTTLNSASHRANIQGNVFEYSIGEMSLITTEHSSRLIVTQGYYQPQSSNSTSISNEMDMNAQQIKVYPNPTENVLHIESVEQIGCRALYDLYDAAGKIVFHNEQQLQEGTNHQTIDFSSFAVGSYFLTIRKSSATQNYSTYTCKVQKSN